jgi:hypothetical protein
LAAAESAVGKPGWKNMTVEENSAAQADTEKTAAHTSKEKTSLMGV